LAVGKAAGGYFGNSQAMIADAAHSLSDLITDAVTLWSHRLAREPWSERHPYGHGKYETIGAMAVSIALFFTGITNNERMSWGMRREYTRRNRKEEGTMKRFKDALRFVVSSSVLYWNLCIK
jgi:hypothetical protein